MLLIDLGAKNGVVDPNYAVDKSLVGWVDASELLGGGLEDQLKLGQLGV